MIVPDRTTNRFRIDGLSLKASATRIGRHLHACFLTSVFAVILSMLFVTPASAAITCYPANVGKVVTAGTIVIPMNAPSGSVVRTLTPDAFQMQCALPNGTSGTSTIRLTLKATLAPGFTDVYKTNIDGLGIRYVFNAPECSASDLSLSNSSTTSRLCSASSLTLGIRCLSVDGFPVYPRELVLAVTPGAPAAMPLDALVMHQHGSNAIVLVLVLLDD